MLELRVLFFGFVCVSWLVRATEIEPYPIARLGTNRLKLYENTTMNHAKLRPQAVHENTFFANKGSRPSGKQGAMKFALASVG